jgi:hypothetical protein
MPFDTVSAKFIIIASICIFTDIRKGKMREKQINRNLWFPSSASLISSEFVRDVLTDNVADRVAQQVSDGIRKDVRREIKGMSLVSFGLQDTNTSCLAVTTLDGIEKRAWMLLQAAGIYLFAILDTAQLTILNRVSRYREID